MPRPTAAVVVPTAARPAALDVALRSIAPQAAALGATVLVVDDGPSAATDAVVRAHGARRLAHDRPRGPNAARNTGLLALGACGPGGAPLPGPPEAPGPDLAVFVDDDVHAPDGWLAALLDAASADPGADVVGGPIVAVLEGPHRHRSGRFGEPITALDLGPVDRDVPRVWSANLAVRTATTRRLGGFDERLEIYGDEEELQERVLRAGGRVRYAAAAGLEHRRAAAEATVRALSAAQRHRGRQARRWDARRGTAPGVGAELALAARCAAATVRHRETDGIWTTAHALGRLEEAALGYPPAPTDHPDPDFLSGTSGEVGGRRGRLLRAHDAWLDRAARRAGRDRALAAARARTPPQRVLVVVPARPERAAHVAALRGPLTDGPHAVDVRVLDPAGRPKFRVVDAAVAAAHADAGPTGARAATAVGTTAAHADPDAEPAARTVAGAGPAEDVAGGARGSAPRRAAPVGLPADLDWLVVCDDDVELPPRALADLLAVACALDLAIAQPAHRRHGHAAWEVTRRSADATVLARETSFVEIGPVTLLRADACARLLPFPAEAGMGWGLDAHWSAVALDAGLRLGVIDAVAVGHVHAPAGSGYDRARAVADGRALLADRPHVRRHEVRTLRAHRVLPPDPEVS